MLADDRSQVSRIIHAALTREGRERAAFVRAACAGDAVLQRDVESLLAYESAAVSFLSTPAVAMAVSTRDGQPTDDAFGLAPGERFGPYLIERLLGRGGMGEVYEAEHVEHGRRIALKLSTRRLTNRTDRERFLREGQLAASVSHPHTVYIYSSEEIAGIPVIAMELLPGGTLQDRVDRSGPLAPHEAVDAILQVVSGLAEAHAAGILHRDIKPSNCFVDTDETVKIGDFGLSIPTRTRDDTQLTVTGDVLATPRFASPEQLRGQPLDARSDIYSVGATLYYLLTGRPPFDDRDLMVLVSRVANDVPASPREVRPEIPEALAAIVLRCLAKDPARRPASYSSLAGELAPLSSTFMTPAPLGIRCVAAIIDSFVSQVVLIAPALMMVASSAPAFGARPLWQTFVGVAYFAITEGVWGTSPGKALGGLRVVTEDGGRPGVVRALVRALVFAVPLWFAGGLALWVAGSALTQRLGGAWIVIVANSIAGALLFAAARRANGFAGIHEWASRTRTVVASSGERSRIVRPAPTPLELPASPQRVGPYALVAADGGSPHGGAALGYDERLRRTVWMRFPAVNSAAVPLARRIVRRSARPRWLAGQRTDVVAWDAYEAVPGQPFERLLTRAQPWVTVRGWLRDLAQEAHAGLGDGSLPALEFERIWIGNDGRARLLDWPLPIDRLAPAVPASPQQTAALPQVERFLYRVAVSALEGQALAESYGPDRIPRAPLPLAATECLRKLGRQGFSSSEEMASALTSAAHGPAAVSRIKRAGHVSLCALPTILLLVLGMSSAYRLFARPAVDAATRDIRELALCLSRLEALDDRGVSSTDLQHRALEIYVSGRHRDLISDPPIWSSSLLAQRIISSRGRAIAMRVAATRPSAQDSDVDDAARILRPFLDASRSVLTSAHPYVQLVHDGAAAHRAGLEVNDVVIAMDDQPMAFASQLGAAIRSHPEQLIALSVLRDGQPLTIRATPARSANQGLLGIVLADERGVELTPKVTWRYFWLHALVGLMLAGTIGLLSGLAARGGLALRLMRIAVVTRDGTLASRSRAGLRAVVSWLPVLAASVAAFAGQSPLLTMKPQIAPFFAITPSLPPVFPTNVPAIFFPEEPSFFFARVAIIAVALAVFAIGAMCAVIRPAGGLHDRLTGTSLVPR